MRDYGTGTWEGGDTDCDHLQVFGKVGQASTLRNDGRAHKGPYDGEKATMTPFPFRETCGKCGASRVDQQLGLEPTPDLYVQNMVGVFREVRRVLAAHGTLWLNLGDSYASAWACDRRNIVGNGSLKNGKRDARPNRLTGGLKEKDLVGIPWRTAFALQQPYYTGRIAAERDRVWLSAIIDGEGTICGMRHVRPNGNVRTGCMVFVTNTSEALLDECDRIWPGSRYSEKVTSEVSRPCWRWELQSAEARSALVRELYPYLIEKKRQALVAWNLLELVQSAKRMGRGGETPETKAKRDLLVRVLSDLNQRRGVDVPSWLREPPSLYEQGWYLRSDVIWAKNNPMPESVTDRPTKAHEYVFLLSKRPSYWFDQEAVREPHTGPSVNGRAGISKDDYTGQHRSDGHVATRTPLRMTHRDYNPAGRNVRSVWDIPTQPYPEAHFATYPEKLVERCLLAGCPEWVCGTCGKPRERIVERALVFHHTTTQPSHADSPYAKQDAGGIRNGVLPQTETVGWSDCGHNNYRSGVVLDPFLGSGTTAHVARRLSRHTIGIELNPSYAELAARRLAQLSLLAEGAYG